MRWILGGIIGGALGGLVWVLIGYLTQYEVGWIAWGVGFLVGVGVRIGAEDEGIEHGIGAAIVAILSVVAAKFILFSIVVGGVPDAVIGDETMISIMADEVVQEKIDNGETVNWPPGMTLDDASSELDYPPEIWREGETRWNALTSEEQQLRRDQLAEVIKMIQEQISPSFTDTFSAWDALWFALAAITAFRIAAGGFDSE